MPVIKKSLGQFLVIIIIFKMTNKKKLFTHLPTHFDLCLSLFPSLFNPDLDGSIQISICSSLSVYPMTFERMCHKTSACVYVRWSETWSHFFSLPMLFLFLLHNNHRLLHYITKCSNFRILLFCVFFSFFFSLSLSNFITTKSILYYYFYL